MMMGNSTRSPASEDDAKFQKVVQHFLKTPPKPHKEMKHKGGKKQGDDRRQPENTS